MPEMVYLAKVMVPTFFDHFSLRSTAGDDWYYRLNEAGAYVRSTAAFGTLANGLRPADSLTTAVTNYLSMTDSTGQTWQIYPDSISGNLATVTSGIAGTAKTVSTGITLRCENAGARYRRHIDTLGKHLSHSTNSTTTTDTKRFSIGARQPVFDSVFWKPRLLNPVNVEWRLFSNANAALGARVIPRFGVMDLFIGDAENDDLMDFSWDSRDITLYRGDDSLPLNGFGAGFSQGYDKGSAVLQTRTRNASWTYDRLSLALSDGAADLSVKPIAPFYQGTGGYEGPESLAGTSKPMGFGTPTNCVPALLNATDFIYQVHAGSIQGIINVYDQGVPLASGGDITSITGVTTLEEWAPITGEYVTDLANGAFRLGAPPAGIVTVDFQGANVDTAGYARTASTILRKIAVDIVELTDPTDLAITGFVNVEASNNANMSLYVTPGANLTVADVFDEIMAAVGGYWGYNDANKLKIGIIELGTSRRTIEEKDFISLTRVTPENPPLFRLSIGYKRSWSVQTNSDLAESVTGLRRDQQTNVFRYATVENTDIRTRRELAQNVIKGGLLDNKSDALAEANRQFDLFSVDRNIYQLRGVRDLQYELEVGDTVTLKIPRFGLSAGQTFIIVGRVENASQELTDLTLWG